MRSFAGLPLGPGALVVSRCRPPGEVTAFRRLAAIKVAVGLRMLRAIPRPVAVFMCRRLRCGWGGSGALADAADASLSWSATGFPKVGPLRMPGHADRGIAGFGRLLDPYTQSDPATEVHNADRRLPGDTVVS